MAYTRKKATKAGKEFYEIIVNMGPGRQYSTRWYIPTGWSKRAIERQLAKVSSEFERDCHEGKVLSRKEKEAKQAETSAYTAPELAYILQCLEKVPLKWRALVTLMMDTGIWRGECCGLQWKYVDFQHNEITIAHNLCYTPQKGVYLDTPQNGKQRTIPVDPSVMALLNEWRVQQAEETASLFVFSQNNSSEAMHPQSPARSPKKFGAKYGVEDLHPHKLCHSFASVAITNGADIASVSEVLGHRDKSITLRMYTHADKESITRAENIFCDAVKNSAASGA